MTMYFSRVTLGADNVRGRKLLQNISQNAYYEHQCLWGLFPESPDASRDFIYRGEVRHLTRVYYMVSSRQPQPSSEWLVETRPYQPKIIAGDQLAFSLRVNPVITRKNAVGKPQRHDVVMNTKKEMDYAALSAASRPPMGAVIQQAGIQWLENRKEKYGFEFDPESVIVERYDQHQAYKQGNKGAIRYSSMDFSGVLTVVDSELFSQTLMHGVGPAKAFGCGLLLVRRM